MQMAGNKMELGRNTARNSTGGIERVPYLFILQDKKQNFIPIRPKCPDTRKRNLKLKSSVTSLPDSFHLF